MCKGRNCTPIFTCPGDLIDDESWYTLRLYHFYQKGMLPSEGTILDQTAVFVEVMMLIDADMSRKGE